MIGALTSKDNLVGICSAPVNRDAPISGQSMHIDRNFVDAYDRRRGHAPPLLSGNLRRLSKRHQSAS
ncbi:MAG: hypothetical protein CBB94_11105 [Gammaproteobacteria bacterium TMED34]|nr:MAG: hypothetical protein CBB94_11105 [Gammaproteobacteria bacterium TMED34]